MVKSNLNKQIILPHTRLGTIHYCSREVSSHAHRNQRVEFHQVLQKIDVKKYDNNVKTCMPQKRSI